MSSEIEVTEHPDYRTINVTGVISGHQMMSFQLIFYSEELDCKDALTDRNIAVSKVRGKRTLECRLLMSAFTAKILHGVLTSEINAYEKMFGNIPTKNEIKDKKPEGTNPDNPTVYT
ncbi:MAG TPA: hypothetical protein VJ772_04965 [Nitrososphaeraceae archaeon]|nr:hypothetical protein [Nitrososphaeraceae archaeon]